MYRLIWIFLSCVVLTTGCQKTASKSVSLTQDESIQAYFNHRENNQHYTDPYRQIERSGDNLESLIIDEIATAKFSIDLAVQELNLPLIAQALVASKVSGVKVRVILDNNYSQALSTLDQQEVEQLNKRDRLKYSQFFQLVDLNQDGRLTSTEIAHRDALIVLRQAGIPLIDDTADGSKGSGLMHHKFMVVDGQKVITGSTNFTISGIHGDLDNLDTKGNVNHLLVIQNQQLASLFIEEFNYMWGGTENQYFTPQFGLDKPQRMPVSLTWKNTELTVQFSPTSNTKDWHFSTNGLIGKTINNSQNSIDLALFVFSEQEIADILQAKHHNGLKIRGVFDHGFAFRYYSEVLDLLGLTLYRKACQPEVNNNPWDKSLTTIGVANLNTGDKLHHKFALIDSDTVISGSQNWSKAGNRQNDETLIIIKNHTVAQHFAQEFERLYNSAYLSVSSRIENKLQQQKQKCP